MGPGHPVSAVPIGHLRTHEVFACFERPLRPACSGHLTGLTAYFLHTALPLARGRLVRLRLHGAAENLQALSPLVRAPILDRFSGA